MNTGFKFLAAVLGLAVTAGAISDASAATVTTTKTIAHAKIVKPAPLAAAGYRHRLRFVHRGVVKHVVIAHRLAPRMTVVKKTALRPIGKTTIVKSRLVGAQKSAMIHRSISKTTVVR